MNESQAVISADAAGVICGWNAAAEALLGYSAEEAVGKRLDMIIPERYHSAHWTGFGAAMERGSVKNANLHGNLPLVRRDGSERHCPGRLTFLRDAFGNAAGAVGVFTSSDDVANNGLMTMP